MDYSFPKTPHLFGSKRVHADDPMLSERDTTAVLRSKYIVEEKLDGSNLGIYFDSPSALRYTARAKVDFEGSSHENLVVLRRTVLSIRGRLWEALGTQFVLFGEWMYVVHCVKYRNLGF